MAVTLTPMDLSGRERGEFVRFMTRSSFPFHVTSDPTEETVTAHLDAGHYDDADHAPFWVEVDDFGRIGIAILEDLSDDTPMFDLRLATRYRGQGLGVPILTALTSLVFDSYPDVRRFEGQTREDNVAMRKVFLRSGFVKEAHYRDGWPVAGGDAVASVAYAILRRDWASGTTTPVPWND